VTQCFDLGNDYIWRVFTTRVDNVQYPLLWKLKRLWSSHSQPGMSHWAGVLEVWIWTYYTAEANVHLDGPENAPKYAFLDPKMTPPPHTLTPYTLGACGISILVPLDLVPSKPKSWIQRPWPCTLYDTATAADDVFSICLIFLQVTADWTRYDIGELLVGVVGVRLLLTHYKPHAIPVFKSLRCLSMIIVNTDHLCVNCFV